MESKGALEPFLIGGQGSGTPRLLCIARWEQRGGREELEGERLDLARGRAREGGAESGEP